MPIYEFRCLKCQEVFELLKVKEEDELEMKCPHCNSPDFERVLSTTSYAVGFSGGKSPRPAVASRQCASGSCTTVDLPGHSKS
jgi:putative FmdB family regulatory protein